MKEKENFSKKKKIVDSHAYVSSSKINNDICIMKNNIDCLGSTLSQCAMDYKKLESIFLKKHAPHIYGHKLRHTHAHHAHTRDSLYANVYTCTHCGRKDHLANFYYDRLNNLNFASKNAWVRKGAYPSEPKKFRHQNLSLFYLI